jgi:hypothetical protein
MEQNRSTQSGRGTAKSQIKGCPMQNIANRQKKTESQAKQIFEKLREI